jgi:hypothetical protein
MSKFIVVLIFSSAAFLTGCSTLIIESYKPTEVTRDALAHAPDNYSVGGISGVSRVESDQLAKSSLPCRMQTFQMPDEQPVNLYIESALKSELQAASKLAAPEGRRIDIVVVKLESDTSKFRNGSWTLDFQYKIGKITRNISTVTEYGFDKDATVACRNTANAFDDALRTNFAKFFKTLN